MRRKETFCNTYFLSQDTSGVFQGGVRLEKLPLFLTLKARQFSVGCYAWKDRILYPFSKVMGAIKM